MTLTTRMMEMKEEGITEGIEIGRNEGINIGLEKGAYQKAIETAKNMIAIGMSTENIAQCTGLPMDEVQQIKNTIN